MTQLFGNNPVRQVAVDADPGSKEGKVHAYLKRKYRSKQTGGGLSAAELGSVIKDLMKTFGLSKDKAREFYYNWE